MSGIKSTLIAKLKEFKKLKQTKERYEKKVKDTNKEIGKLQPKMVELFEHLGVESMKITGVGMYYLEAQSYPNIKSKDKLLKWLKKNKLGSLIKSDIGYQTLRGLINERLKNGLSIPAGVETYDETKVKLRKV